jgi:L-lactate dehydrogenase complex protein LldF
MHHSQAAARFIADLDRAHWHDQALWYVRAKRDMAVQQVPEWEQLREQASAIKAHVQAHLADYLEQFEARAISQGVQVHWASTAEDHNRIVYDILTSHSARLTAKSKSMLTEECGLNHFLEERGIELVDTDLGERIVQLRKEPPSHIVLPAIHLKKRDVSDLFHERLGTELGNVDEKQLTEAARAHLRKVFVSADAGISGVNFAIAETGGIVVCTNEGNADLGTSFPSLHIACLGIEKLIPRVSDLAIFTRMLARSATGQPITTYTTHFQRPVQGGELHYVLVDNGRTALRKLPQFRKSLFCIRCGACLNTCPVYRRSGGHSYGTTIPGPIGSVLAPSIDMQRFSDLPFASSLCGSCTDVCPVKIDLHEQLLAWRREVVKEGRLPWRKWIEMRVISFVLANPRRLQLVAHIGRMVQRLPRYVIYNPLNPWGRQREVPTIAKKSFRDWYSERKKRIP